MVILSLKVILFYPIQTKIIFLNLLVKYYFQTQINSFNFNYSKNNSLTLILLKVISFKVKPNGPLV